jgi:hypothetical protein
MQYFWYIKCASTYTYPFENTNKQNVLGLPDTEDYGNVIVLFAR